MPKSQLVSAHLPELRRYARALTGSQDSGDAYVAGTVETLSSPTNCARRPHACSPDPSAALCIALPSRHHPPHPQHGGDLIRCGCYIGRLSAMWWLAQVLQKSCCYP